MPAPTAHSPAIEPEQTDAAFVAEAGRIRQVVGEQRLLSQSRCVDQVLDLLNLTVHRTVRAELTRFLSQIRKLTAVDGDEMRRVLDVTVMAAHVEEAYLGVALR